MPMSADLINPTLTTEQLTALRARRHTQYINNIRHSTIKRVCKANMTKNECKKKIKEDYLETLKYFEKTYQE
jgi:hypothetical protein